MSTVPIAPRRARRFWLAVFAFAVANVAAWVAWDRSFAARHRGTLRVESFEPGDNNIVSPTTVVRWRFDADVIPTDVYAKPPGQTSPAVAGRWAWESPRTLSFVPATGLPRAVPVAFTLSPELLRTTTGASLKTPYVTHVRPAPLTVAYIRQSAVMDDAYVLELSFSDRVVPGDVLAHLAVTGPDGRGVGCHLFGQAAGDKVRVQTDRVPTDPAGGNLRVELSPGLVGAAGPLGLGEPYETTVTLTRVLSATQMTARTPTRGQASLTINFTGEVDFEPLRRVLSVEPAVPFSLSSEGSSAELTGPFRPGTRYTVRIADPPKDVVAADRPLYPRPGTLAAFVPDAGRDCWFDTDEGYLSTDGNRTLVAHVVNVDQLRVTVTRVYDDNLVAWRNVYHGYSSEAGVDLFARPAAERTIDCPGPKNDRRDVPIKLDDLLPPTLARSGVWMFNVEPAKRGDGERDRYYYNSRTSAVVTLSDIGLTAKRTRGGLVAWATSLRAARPMAGVRVRAYSDKNQLLGTATTGDDGLARIDRIEPGPGEVVAVLLADLPGDATDPTTGPTTRPTTQPAASGQLTWLDLRRAGWELGDADTSGAPYLRAGHAAFVYTDRGVYRPGETVHLRAIVHGPGDVASTQAFPVRWRFRRPDLHDWRIVPAMLAADGTAAVDVPLPDDLPTGHWSADVALPGDDKGAEPFGSVSFQVEEFIPNRLKVALKLTPDARVSLGDDPLSADVQADYLFGRPAAGLTVDLTAHATPVPFTPTGWDGWTFGDAADVRSADVATSSHKHHEKRKVTAPAAATSTLNGSGHYRGTIDVADAVHMDLNDAAAHPDRYRGPWRLTADASIAEAGGRAVTVSRQVDVDAVPMYVAVRRAGGSSATPGEPCAFEVKLARPDGTPVTDGNDVAVRLLREHWNVVTVHLNGQYRYECNRVLEPVASDQLHVADGPARWAPVPPTRGRYVVEATAAEGGAVTTSAFYATDGSGWDETIDQTHPDRLDVRVLGPGEPDVPATDARTRPAAPPQRVGSTARVLVAAPFAGRLLLTVETDAVVQSQVIEMTASHMVVPVDVTAACRPGAFVTATVLRPIDPNAPWRAHRAFGVGRLNVDPIDQKLTVALDAPKELRPMRSLDVGLTVTLPDGKPAADAAVAVAAVDEGICSVTGFATPDPLAFFTAKRGLGVESGDVFSLLMPEAARSDIGGDGSADEKVASGGRHRSPVGAHRVRPVALAWVTVHTDRDGRATASFPVPAFQGRLRVMAIANTADRVGSGDRGVTVRSPLLAQTSWPRFAAPGDRFVVPITLFNNRPIAGNAVVTIQPVGGDPLLSFDAPLPTVALAPGGQQRVDLNVTVAQRVGVARVRLTTDMAGETYSEELELPVRPAAPFSQFGGIARGTVTQPATLTGMVPMMPGTGSLRVDVAPWPTLNLPKGLDYLDRYPYGCAEQTTSTLFPLVALGEVGRQLDPDRFDPQRIRTKVDYGVNRLIAMQTADGGLSMWIGQSNAWPWASVYAAHFLTVARTDGYAVPDDFYNHLMAYVRHQLDLGTDAAGGVEVQAYAAYVLALAGKPERAAMSRLGELATAPPRPDDPADAPMMRGDAQLFLSTAWLLAGRRDLAEDMLPATMPAPRVTRQSDGNLGSPVRDRAIQILTLEQVDPDRADLPDLVQQLADAGVKDRWASTQDVAYATLAVGQYLQLQAGHHHAPYDTARLLLTDALLASTDGGRPLTWTGDVPAGSAVRVQLTGPADAVGHVGWLQAGVPLTPPPAASHGLVVHRRYTTLDGRDIHGVVRSGELVRVQVDLTGPSDLANVVLDDLLPAGLEVENARLATAAVDRDQPERTANDPPAFGGGMTDVRDDRVVIVGRIPYGGRARATYLARAVTPGVYAAPPARAEAMYDLNTNGTSASGTLTVTGGSSNVATARE
jgi:uncharacterized protein YfaS (alpha-2-macroglobulin family)